MQGGQRGDLYIVVNVAEHELFEREGDDLLCALPISFSQAALGTQREIPTLDGGVNLKIPAGTQSHKVFRVRGRGMPNLRRTHARGDLYIRVVIETPKKLNDQQRELLEEFARISGDEVHPLSRNFFDKVKDAFGV
jgi:molecular chaperone DnaJ